MKRADVVRDYGGISAADRRADRHRKLLAAGRAVWGESGLTEVTVRGVSAASGLTPRYFYEHFPNREALLLAIVDEVRDQLIAVLVDAGLGDSGDLEHKLRAALHAFLDAIAADPHIHRIMTSDLTSVPALVERRREALTLLSDIVIGLAPDLLGPSTPAPDRLRRAAQYMAGGVNQLIEDWLIEPKETTAELASVCADLSLAVIRQTLR